MHVVTTETVCCSAGFLRTYVVWLGGRGSELWSVYENWYMNIDHVVYTVHVHVYVFLHVHSFLPHCDYVKFKNNYGTHTYLYEHTI